MANRMDWIPRQEEKLLELMAVWKIQLSTPALQAAYGWPAAECTQVTVALAFFVGARETYQEAPTPANRTEKDEAKAAAIAAMRRFARERVRNNRAMSDGQKQGLGVTVADREPSPAPLPGAGPDSEADTSAKAPGVVRARYLGPKPYGVDRVEIAWALSDTPLDSPDQLACHETFSRNPWERAFAHGDRGKKLYYSMRYLTKEGASAWSEVREVIVP